MIDGRIRRTLFVLFFLSGCCALIYEIVWARMLVVVFGTSVHAVSTVVAAFMGGLALGGACVGRLADRHGNPLRLYAWIELGLAGVALAFPFGLLVLDDLYTVVYRRFGGNALAFEGARFLLSFLVLLVPTTLMGATLPVLSKYVTDRAGRIGRSVGGLYAINTLGAAAGAGLATFVLMERFGVRGTIFLAAAVNLAIAGVAFALSAKERLAVRVAGPAPPISAPVPVREVSSSIARLALLAFAVSGCTALGYEVVWTRLIGIALGLTTTQSLSTMLIAFLGGLAAGGAIGARLADRIREPVAAFGLAQLLLGLAALGSIAAFAAIPAVLSALGPAPSWWAYVLRSFLVACGVMLVPTCLMGVMLPLAGRLYARDLRTLAERVGGIYAANTVGAVAGALGAGFLLVPHLGSQRTIQALAAINVAVGAALVLASPASLRRKRVLVGTVALPLLILACAVPPGIVVRSIARSQDGKLVHWDEDAAGTVAVYDLANHTRVLRVNGAGEVPTDHASIQTFRLLGSLPLLLHPRAEDVLVIAFGGGVTLAAVEAIGPRHIDCVEVAPAVVRAAPQFADYNGRVFERLGTPALELIADDGRNHVLRTDRVYDVIISDATHPGSADSWVLYTEEFYRLCERRLRPGGLVAQWLPLHGLGPDDFRLILRTFRAVFPHATLWWTTDYSILLGTPAPLAIDLESLRARLARPGVAERLAEVELGDPLSLLATLVLDEDGFARHAGAGVLNRDDLPPVSFAGASRTGAGGGIAVMIDLFPHVQESLEHCISRASQKDIERLQRRWSARKHAFAGEIHLKLGNRDQAMVELKLARSLDPGETRSARALGSR